MNLFVKWLRRTLRFNASLQPIDNIDDWIKAKRSIGWGLGPGDALEVAAVSACLEVIIDGLITLPLKLLRRADGGVEPARDDRRYGLLHSRPNPAMGHATFLGTWLLPALTTGTAFAEIVEDGGGRPSALWPLRDGAMRLHRYAPDGSPIWVYTKLNGSTVTLPDRLVLRVPMLSRDGLLGENKLALADRDLAILTAASDVVKTYFANGAFPAGVVSRPAEAPTLSPTARDNLLEYVSSFRAEGSGKMLLTEEGTKVERWQDSPDKAMPHEVIKRQIGEVARRWRVPLPKLQDWERATWSNATEADRAFYAETLAPITVRITEELNYKLLLPREEANLSFEFVWQGLQRSDPKEQAETLRQLTQADLMEVNEAREFLNLPAYPGPLGGRRYRPVNVTVVGHPEEFASAQKSREEGRTIESGSRSAAVLAVAKPLIARVLRRSRHAVEARAAKWSDPVAEQVRAEQIAYAGTEVATLAELVAALGGNLKSDLWLGLWAERTCTPEAEGSLVAEAASDLLKLCQWRTAHDPN